MGIDQANASFGKAARAQGGINRWGNRFALSKPHFQRRWEKSLDRGCLDHRDHFHIALHPFEVEPHKIVFELHAGPSPNLFASNGTVGFGVEMMNRKRGVFVKEALQGPVAPAGQTETTDSEQQQAAEHHREAAKSTLTPLARAQLDVEHALAFKTPVFWLTPEPHWKATG